MTSNILYSQIKSKKHQYRKCMLLAATIFLIFNSNNKIIHFAIANDPFHNTEVPVKNHSKTASENYKNQKILDDTQAEATELGTAHSDPSLSTSQHGTGYNPSAPSYTQQTDSILGLFWQADIVVKSIMIFLLLASIYSWTIIVNRIMIFSQSNKKIKKFEELFWSGQPLDSILKRTMSQGDPAPTAVVFIAAMEELNAKNSGNALAKNLKLRLENTINVAANRALYSLQEGFSGLAITSLVSPFVGLFGTVWGIMNTFPKIAASKHVTIATVAPGMAEALLATAIGLLAAIPACIFYNKFNSDLQQIEGKVDEFKGEIMNIILRDLEEN